MRRESFGLQMLPDQADDQSALLEAPIIAKRGEALEFSGREQHGHSVSRHIRFVFARHRGARLHGNQDKSQDLWSQVCINAY